MQQLMLHWTVENRMKRIACMDECNVAECIEQLKSLVYYRELDGEAGVGGVMSNHISM